MPIAPDIPAAEVAIVEMTNAFRKGNKLAAVERNPQLDAAAQAYAKVLAARRKDALSHTIDGTTPAARARAAGYQYCQIAENLALAYDSKGFTSAEYARRTLRGWQESPGHRRNLLMPNVTETGIAVARTSPNDPRYIAVQLFGRPMALKYSFKVANKTTGAVDYTFAGDAHEVQPRQIITHTSCDPGDVDFKLDTGNAAGRYVARDGVVYTLRPREGGGVQVDVSR
jgi:Cysteine-rich secretory protein family